MIKYKTVIIVGAGASAEARLPIGTELNSKIARMLDIRFESKRGQISGDETIQYALKRAEKGHINHQNINSYLNAAWAIRDAMPQALSIDNYIDVHNGDEKIELCGKLAITKSILEAERNSSLYINRSSNQRTMNFEGIQDTWYKRFLQILIENCHLEELPERLSSLVLVVFNYDRCIEHFLFHALQNYYNRIKAEQSSELVNSIKIFHPYGQVGFLPWQGRRQPSIDFGADPNFEELLALAEQVRTFSEGTDPKSSSIDEIKRNVGDSELLIFLGFAYHRLNMEILKSQQIGEGEVRCFGTAWGISQSDCQIIERNIDDLNAKDLIELNIRNNLTCSGLFDEYWRSLSIG